MEMFTKNNYISQKYLRELRNRRNKLNFIRQQIKALKSEKELLELEIAEMENNILEALAKGLKPSPGKLVIKVFSKLKPRRVSWKKVFVEYEGEEEAQKIMSSITPVEEKHVEVIEK